LSAIFATDLDGFPGDGDLDCISVEGVITSCASSCGHGLFLLTRGSGRDSRPRRFRPTLSQFLEKGICGSSTQGGAFEGGRGASVCAAEGGCEMAVAGEADFEGEGGEVVEPSEEIERARKAKAQLIAVKRHSLDLLKDLREIDGGAVNFSGNVGQGPATR